MNHYSVLNLKDGKTYTDDEIKEAYRKALLLFHPDKCKEKPSVVYTIDQVKEAYQVLSSEKDRQQYQIKQEEGNFVLKVFLLI